MLKKQRVARVPAHNAVQLVGHIAVIGAGSHILMAQGTDHGFSFGHGVNLRFIALTCPHGAVHAWFYIHLGSCPYVS